MKEEYDFSRAKRGSVVPVAPGKTQITLPLDDDVLEWFRGKVHEMGGGDYRTLINDALREHMQQKEPLKEMLRRVIREEMRTQFAS